MTAELVRGDTWGDRPASGRRRSPRHGSRGRRRIDRGRHRKGGCAARSALLAVLWAAWTVILLAALVLWF